jgi:hypothetical protein
MCNDVQKLLGLFLKIAGFQAFGGLGFLWNETEKFLR